MAPSKIKPQIAKLLTKAMAKSKAKNAQIAGANADTKMAIDKIVSMANQNEKAYSEIIAKVKAKTEEIIANIRSESA